MQQQVAGIFGLQASDLKAITSGLGIGSVKNTNLSYGGMLGRLSDMANSMYSRTSLGEMLKNTWGNIQYSTAAGIANNPVLYGIYKIAGLLDSAMGGIAIPAISVMGNMVDLHTTVADLMRVGALSGGILSSLGQMIAAGITSGGNGGLTGQGLLNAFKVSGYSLNQRGNSGGIKSSGTYLSGSGSTMIGNSEGSSVLDKTMADADDSKNSQLIQAQEGNKTDNEDT